MDQHMREIALIIGALAVAIPIFMLLAALNLRRGVGSRVAARSMFSGRTSA